MGRVNCTPIKNQVLALKMPAIAMILRETKVDPKVTTSMSNRLVRI